MAKFLFSEKTSIFWSQTTRITLVNFGYLSPNQLLKSKHNKAHISVCKNKPWHFYNTIISSFWGSNVRSLIEVVWHWNLQTYQPCVNTGTLCCTKSVITSNQPAIKAIKIDHYISLCCSCFSCSIFDKCAGVIVYGKVLILFTCSLLLRPN